MRVCFVFICVYLVHSTDMNADGEINVDADVDVNVDVCVDGVDDVDVNMEQHQYYGNVVV